MTEDTTPIEEVVEDAFPTLTLISEDFVGEEGIDFDGLTTEQLLHAVREAFLMHHQAMQEVTASVRTLGMFMGALDDRVENKVPEAAPENPTPSPIVLPTLRKDS